MVKVNLSLKTKIFITIIINIILIIGLINFPIDNNHSICLFTLIFKKECFNCGMTRAFLSVLHFDFNQAIAYNKNVIIVFPLVTLCYIGFWFKFLFKKSLFKIGKIEIF